MSEADDIDIDRGPQQTLNIENPWLNVIMTHSKFTSSPFISLFSTSIPIFSPSFSLLYGDDTKRMQTRQSVSESRGLKSTGKSVWSFLILHDKLTN